MAGQGQSNTDQFEAYFKLADLDHDGRISGKEAVSFFQGSNLTSQVLAQIWMIADHNRTDFLGRQEFYNMLKLVTVAQSKRELTPDIVKAALYSPASAKIPAPQINLSPTSSQQVNVGTSSVSTPPPSAVTIMGSQITGSKSPEGFASQQNLVMRPPVPVSPNTNFQTPGGASSPAVPPNGSNFRVPYSPSSSVHPGTSTQLSQMGVNSVLPKVMRPLAQDGLTMPLSGLSPPTQTGDWASSNHPALSKPSNISVGGQVETRDSRAVTLAENGHASDILFGNVSSMSAAQPKQGSTIVASSLSSSPAPSNMIRQLTVNSSPLESLHSTVTKQHMDSQHQHGHPPVQSNQQVSSKASAAFPTGAINPAGQSQASWPKMTRTDVQKYSKVFMQVDTDRDGKITGEQAHNLFLSWRQPREVLMQVWDLSDQDNDGMLSLREFCISLYLMERYREGYSLPGALPSTIMDETMFTVFSQPTTAQGNAFLRSTPGFQQPQSIKGTRAVAFGGAGKPPRPLPVSQPEDAVQPSRQKPRVPVLEKQLLDQLSTEEQNSLNSKFQEATEAEKKVSELEKEITDAREKIQFYHAKMQELILYKSRCDNRLNEIMERVSADKREVDSLAKKYEEKCRQSGDVASRLSIEEATFRDIQAKKMELYRAISKLGQDGNANAFLERASLIQLDLEELVKSLNDRCKDYGLRAKPTSLVELPFGWQPGIQGGAADWDESWDKFEDEGFTFVKELTLDVQNVIAPPKPKSSLVRNKEALPDEVVKSSDDANVKGEEAPNNAESVAKNGMNTHIEEQPSQSSDSPRISSGFDTGSREVENSHFKKEISFDGSPHATQSEHGAAESVFARDKVFDEPSWGTFDSQYDSDAAWDFNHATTKDSESKPDSSLFGSDGWGLNPIRTGSTYADNAYSKQGPFFDSVSSTPVYNSVSSPQAVDIHRRNTFFDSSVPSTPMYNPGGSPLADNISQMKSPFAFADSVPSSPMLNSSEDRPSFDSFSRFDSFSMQDGDLFAPQESSFSRFDSMRSTNDSEYNPGLFAPKDSFARFDSFSSTADSDYNFGSAIPPRDSFTRFDSMRSTTTGSDYNHGFSSFDNADPFGSSDPFKTSVENQTPRKDSDLWKAF